MATNYTVNYEDERFTEVESDKTAALEDLDNTYDGIIEDSQKGYNDLIDASKENAEKQTQLQNAQTDFAIKEINQQKANTKKDYLKEQSGAYVDWQKQSNQYGVEAEQRASIGMAGTGYSESSLVSMYTTYQNRVATARESYVRAVQNYDNAITEARLQNNSILAEIAYNALQEQLKLSLEAMQYKNSLLIQKSAEKREINNEYYSRWKDVLNQINTENALAEEVRKNNATLAEQRRQFNQEMAFKQMKFDYQKVKDASSKFSGGSSGSIRESSSTSVIKPTKKAGFTGTTYSEAVKYLEARGVPSSYASSIMTKGEWSGRKSKYVYDSYQAYLKDAIDQQIEDYAK